MAESPRIDPRSAAHTARELDAATLPLTFADPSPKPMRHAAFAPIERVVADQ